MLEAVLDVLDLLFDKLLLLFFNLKFVLSVVCHGEIVHVLHKLLSYVLETVESTSQKEESFNVIVTTTGNRSLQRGNFFINAASLVT